MKEFTSSFECSNSERGTVFSSISMYYRMKIVDNIADNGLNYVFETEKTFRITSEELLKEFGEKFDQSGEIIFEYNDPCFVCKEYVIIPKYMNVVSPSRNYFRSDDFFGMEEDEKANTKVIKTVFKVYTRKDNYQAIKTLIDSVFGKYISTEFSVDFSWATSYGGGTDVDYLTVNNTFAEKIHREAYPYIEDDIDEYITRYLKSDVSILLLMGNPGTGKTRFIRYVIQKIAELSKRNAKVLYTMDEKVIENDNFYFEFLTQGHDILVLEDIDVNLKSRKDGNVVMHKLLGGGDGLLKNDGKKIILSTNILNVNEIDEALVRNGRCHDIVKTRLLSKDEAQSLLKKLNPESEGVFHEDISVGDVYSFMKSNKINNRSSKNNKNFGFI